jgi:hypothetical protein
MEDTMTKIFNIALATAAIAAASATLLTATHAEARGGRTWISQDYQFDKPMHGFQGRTTGGYYCSYQRLPNRVCVSDGAGGEKCAVKGWTLRQFCS